ncbi:EF-hand domain [Trinorchestia longiramus]|nr:EF-hand domain [Trinorchestia longiramus]KAF2352152.1 EF-hand domain [Trinorchestia longiramus]
MSPPGSGKVNFNSFCTIVMPFLEDDDDEAMNEELKEAFRLYDKKGEGFITTQILKEILKELDPKLTRDDLDSIIEEVDEDGSGTVDFDEFMEMMKG